MILLLLGNNMGTNCESTCFLFLSVLYSIKLLHSHGSNRSNSKTTTTGGIRRRYFSTRSRNSQQQQRYSWLFVIVSAFAMVPFSSLSSSAYLFSPCQGTRSCDICVTGNCKYRSFQQEGQLLLRRRQPFNRGQRQDHLQQRSEYHGALRTVRIFALENTNDDDAYKLNPSFNGGDDDDDDDDGDDVTIEEEGELLQEGVALPSLEEDIQIRGEEWSLSALGMNLQELTEQLHGKGKAQLAWDCFKIGLDPLHFYNPVFPQEQLDNALLHATIFQHNTHSGNLVQIGTSSTREQIQDKYLPLKRKSQTMGINALKQLSSPSCYPSPLGIESSIATLEHITRSKDGTTKLLLKLVASSNYFIESVIIPNPEWGKSTLCVSSQVGCKQGCVFCATGKMGRLASLTADQILIQLYYANKVCRVMEDLPQIDNVVFMGMGEAGDNIDSVTKAVQVMTDKSCFGLAPSKITISTVGPEPQVFEKLTRAGTVLAWSVHAVRDDLRKRLVPTTRHSMEELKDGVVKALVHRSRRLRNLMMEVTLIDGINDGMDEAIELADFALDLIDRVEGIKLMVNLIPFNDIGYDQYKRSSDRNISLFQKVLVKKGIKAYVRTTRGDEESAACGQLATKRTKKL